MRLEPPCRLKESISYAPCCGIPQLTEVVFASFYYNKKKSLVKRAKALVPEGRRMGLVREPSAVCCRKRRIRLTYNNRQSFVANIISFIIFFFSYFSISSYVTEIDNIFCG